MTDTTRSQIIDWLATHFSDQRENEPVDDPYSFTWGVVTDDNFTADDERRQYALGIFDVGEEKKAIIQQQDCLLRIIFEFRHIVGKDLRPGKEGRRVLGELQRRMREDIYIGGLALNIYEIANELIIDSALDKTVRGSVTALVHYKHHYNDPRKYL